MSLRSQLCCAVLLGLLLAAPAALRAQRGGGGMGGGMPGGGMPGGGMGGNMGGGIGAPRGGMGIPSPGNPEGSIPRGTPPPGSGGSTPSSMRGGLQLGPPGRWWDDKKFAKSVGLNSDQQKKMDTIFGQNRDALISRLSNLQRAQERLETVTRSAHPTEAAVFAEIDRVTQAQGEMEKALAHYQLLIRDEMTSEQLGKLDDHR